METMAAAKGWMTREAEAAFVELMNVGNQGGDSIDKILASVSA